MYVLFKEATWAHNVNPLATRRCNNDEFTIIYVDQSAYSAVCPVGYYI